MMHEQCNKHDTDKPWTKREMKLAKNPVEELARAVIWQWHLDGEPKADLPAIKYWTSVLKNARK